MPGFNGWKKDNTAFLSIELVNYERSLFFIVVQLLRVQNLSRILHTSYGNCVHFKNATLEGENTFKIILKL